jgi:hypothetical protein
MCGCNTEIKSNTSYVKRNGEVVLQNDKVKIKKSFGRTRQVRKNKGIMEGFFEELFPSAQDGSRKFVVEMSMAKETSLILAGGILAAGLLIKKL